MNKQISYTLVLLCVLTIMACYTDDSSQPNPSRLPFEDFTEFFNDNNSKVDTLVFNADEASSLTTSDGIKINIPEDAFSLSGDVSMKVKEATTKSDFILLNRPTVVGNTVLESSGAISINPFTSAGAANIDNPLEIRINLPTGTTSDDMQFYTDQNGWTLDNAIDIQGLNNEVVIQTDRKNWQMGAKPIADNGSVQLTINATGYGILPHDVKAFVVLSESNSVIALEADVSAVSATGAVPKGIEFDVVIMVMDHFVLKVGTQTMTLNADSSMDVQVEKTEVEEMIITLQSLD